jgi:ubiquitin-conjugating enzyme E2 T
MAAVSPAARARSRIEQELKRMQRDPPHGIGIWPVTDQLDTLEAMIEGPPDSPFAGGEFRLLITIQPNYPNTPPIIKFTTRIYHPNIDSGGRICLDSLKPDPQGTWKPSINLAMVLQQIRILMGEPNIEDPLDTAIADEYKRNLQLYKDKARQMTIEFARPTCSAQGEVKVPAQDEDEL